MSTHKKFRDRTDTSIDLTAAPRTLHLVDLENLIGDPRADAPTALATFEQYLVTACWHPEDLVFVVTNPWLFFEIGWQLPVPCHADMAHGEDGADLKLLAMAPTEWVAGRFDRLVVGSGDHEFVRRATAVAEGGVTVDVVSRPGACSRQLAAIAHSMVRLLPVAPFGEFAEVTESAEVTAS